LTLPSIAKTEGRTASQVRRPCPEEKLAMKQHPADKNNLMLGAIFLGKLRIKTARSKQVLIKKKAS
jgi:hypothetical protein